MLQAQVEEIEKLEATVKHTDLDVLCSFFKHYSRGYSDIGGMFRAIEGMGYKLRVYHDRIANDTYEHLPKFAKLKECSMMLTPASELRASFELASAEDNQVNNNYVSPRGGRTTVELTLLSGKIIKVSSFCSPKTAFNKRKGIMRCMGGGIL